MPSLGALGGGSMRHEFPTSVKRAALERSGGRCEAVGVRYGYAPGERCQRAVHARRVNYEHYPRGAHDPHPETRTLGNCSAICPECNQYANNKVDTPREAKMKRVTKKRGRTALDLDRSEKQPPKIKTRKHSWPQGRKLQGRQFQRKPA